MDVTLTTVQVEELPEIHALLSGWQVEGDPLQLHPGDVGWACRLGPAAAAASLRTWSRGGDVVALGLLDGADLLRLALAPTALADADLAAVVAADLADPARGVLPAGEAFVEAPVGAAVHAALQDRGWQPGEAWTPLHLRLDQPVPDLPVRVEVVDAARSRDWSAVQRSAFDNIGGLDDEQMQARWAAMHEGPAAADSRSLVVYDDAGAPVAAVTVWSAGPGRPGLLEPMGVHHEHRGRGYGRTVCSAAAAALQQLGCSSATVCTPTSLRAAVATYAAAGYRPQEERRDRHRPA